MEYHPNSSHKRYKRSTVGDMASQWPEEFDPGLASCIQNTSPGCSVEQGKTFIALQEKPISYESSHHAKKEDILHVMVVSTPPSYPGDSEFKPQPRDCIP
jgi:hypothetical protein